MYLEIKKQAPTGFFKVKQESYPQDLRGCLIFGKISPSVPILDIIPNVFGTINISSNIIYITDTGKGGFPVSIPRICVGDMLTLEGSGIQNSKILSIHKSQITVADISSNPVVNGRLFLRSHSTAYFNVSPEIIAFNLVLQDSASIGTDKIIVSPSQYFLPSGTLLPFVDNDVMKIAVTAFDVKVNDTVIIINPLISSIPKGANARVGVQSVIVSNSADKGETLIDINSLSIPMPAGTILNFAHKTTEGWEYCGTTMVTLNALPGDTFIATTPLENKIDQWSYAWFGSFPFNSFYLSLDPSDTYSLNIGAYKYDINCRFPDGRLIKLIQGNASIL